MLPRLRCPRAWFRPAAAPPLSFGEAVRRLASILLVLRRGAPPRSLTRRPAFVPRRLFGAVGKLLLFCRRSIAGDGAGRLGTRPRLAPGLCQTSCSVAHGGRVQGGRPRGALIAQRSHAVGCVRMRSHAWSMHARASLARTHAHASLSQSLSLRAHARAHVGGRFSGLGAAFLALAITLRFLGVFGDFGFLRPLLMPLHNLAALWSGE